MNITEALAWQIRRVASIRHLYVQGQGRKTYVLDLMDAALDAACTAIGKGDSVAIAAAGQQLEQFQV